MKQRVALVTGGTRGIGAAIAEALKAKGYRVVVNYSSNHKAAKAFSEDTGITAYCWDLRDFEACEHGVAEITNTWGPIDILINNAGITRDSFLHKMSFAMWAEVIATNLTSCFNMSRLVIGGMREREFGRIINISSINGAKGQIGQTNYAAAKAGVIGFTKSLALENAAKGITVNAIAPGHVDTDMVRAVSAEMLRQIIAHIPTQRLGTAHEIARAVVFLADEDASYITGATLHLNGGQYLA